MFIGVLRAKNNGLAEEAVPVSDIPANEGIYGVPSWRLKWGIDCNLIHNPTTVI
jgi:hypothetical protein